MAQRLGTAGEIAPELTFRDVVRTERHRSYQATQKHRQSHSNILLLQFCYR